MAQSSLLTLPQAKMHYSHALEDGTKWTHRPVDRRSPLQATVLLACTYLAANFKGAPWLLGLACRVAPACWGAIQGSEHHGCLYSL